MSSDDSKTRYIQPPILVWYITLYLLHACEGLSQLLRLLALRVAGEVLELGEEERVLEDALDRLDQVRLQRRRLLLPRVQRVQEVLKGRVAVVWKRENRGLSEDQPLPPHRHLAYTGSSKKVPANFSDTCSVRTDGLCIGCPKMVGSREASN